MTNLGIFAILTADAPSHHPNIKAISNLRFSSEFNYSPVSTSYIRNILDHLNPRKAAGVDGISP